MKWLFRIFFFFIVLIVFVVVGAVYFIPKDKIKAEIVTAVQDKTGRTLAFDENLSLTFFPDFGVSLKDVSLSNADWGTEPYMLRVGELDVALAVKPLINKKIEVKRFVLRQPEIHLEVSKDGKENWSFGAETETQDQDNEEKSGGSSAQDLEVTLGTFEITDAKLTYRDQKEGTSEAVEDIDITIDLPTFDAKLVTNGALTYKAERIKFQVDLDTPKALSEEKPAQLGLSLDALGTTFGFNGAVDLKADTILKGAVDLNIASIKRLADFAAPDAEFDNDTIDSFTAKFDGTVGKTRVTYKGLNFKSALLNITGEGVIDTSKEIPYIQGVYNLSKLDLNKFVTEGEEAPEATNDNQPAQAGNDNWDKTPYDFSGLKALNVDLTANVAGYAYDGIEVGANTLTVKMQNGVLDLGVSDTAVFGGTVSKMFRMDASGQTPRLHAKAKLSQMQATPLVQYLAQTDRLSGTMDGDVDIKMSGTSQDAMVRSMAGTGQFTFRDGEIKGVNVVDWANAFQKRLTSVGKTGGSTKFVELGGSVSIKKGIATNNDFKLVGPLVDLRGSGTVSMPPKTLDYGVKLKLLSQNGLVMPFNIKGPWDSPKIVPDLKAVLENVIADPKAAERQLKDLKNVGKSIEDSFEAEKDAVKDTIKNVKDIKNLLRGF